MGHSLDPGPRALEVTAAAAELGTEDWQLPGGASLRASPSVCVCGGQVTSALGIVSSALKAPAFTELLLKAE